MRIQRKRNSDYDLSDDEDAYQLPENVKKAYELAQQK